MSIALALVAIGLGAWVVGIFNNLVTYRNRYKMQVSEELRSTESGQPTWGANQPKGFSTTVHESGTR